MPVQLFSLRDVPEDEAEEICALLSENNIEYYETSPGYWGISPAGIWLRSEEQLQQARTLIKIYQIKRSQQQRTIYEQLKREGKHRTFWMLAREEPLKVITYIGIVLLILYFSIKPFLSLAN